MSTFYFTTIGDRDDGVEMGGYQASVAYGVYQDAAWPVVEPVVRDLSRRGDLHAALTAVLPRDHWLLRHRSEDLVTEDLVKDLRRAVTGEDRHLWWLNDQEVTFSHLQHNTITLTASEPVRFLARWRLTAGIGIFLVESEDRPWLADVVALCRQTDLLDEEWDEVEAMLRRGTTPVVSYWSNSEGFPSLDPLRAMKVDLGLDEDAEDAFDARPWDEQAAFCLDKIRGISGARCSRDTLRQTLSPQLSLLDFTAALKVAVGITPTPR